MDKKGNGSFVSNSYVEAETISDDSQLSTLSNLSDAVSQKSQPNSYSNEILVVEPFCGGSHKQLIDILDTSLKKNSSYKIHIFSLPAKKWQWRARTSALYFSRVIPYYLTYRVLFCSSVLNLAELIALRRDLFPLFKIIYFHENQLVYPVQKQKERDFQYGYNQILSCLVADCVIFNSHYNMNSFLKNINKFLKLQPDTRIRNLDNEILPKCKVIYFPVEVPILSSAKGETLHIIWPHRWEHDKNPELFFETLFRLKDNKISFRVSVLGEEFEEVPEIFIRSKEILKTEIIQFGRVDSKNEYFGILRSGHVVVSTASHEFFGVAMLEGVLSGCFPLATNGLVYPEIYPPQCLYNTPNQLYKKLKNFCEKPYLAEIYLKRANIDLTKFNVDVIMKQFEEVFDCAGNGNRFQEATTKIKDLIEELEESFQESHKVGNNLILRCVLLRAENQNLVYQMDEKNRSCSTLYHRSAAVSLSKSQASQDVTVPYRNELRACLSEPLAAKKKDELIFLQKTVTDLHKKLEEKEKRIEILCRKNICLKSNTTKMESDLKTKIVSLEEQLDLSYDIVRELQRDLEFITEKSLYLTQNTYEALFLQEKLRCSKLMYEKIRLRHEIQRLEDLARRQEIAREEMWELKSLIDKSTSEPAMRRY